jgi:hypothetical protein
MRGRDEPFPADELLDMVCVLLLLDHKKKKKKSHRSPKSEIRPLYASSSLEKLHRNKTTHNFELMGSVVGAWQVLPFRPKGDARVSVPAPLLGRVGVEVV